MAPIISHTPGPFGKTLNVRLRSSRPLEEFVAGEEPPWFCHPSAILPSVFPAVETFYYVSLRQRVV